MISWTIWDIVFMNGPSKIWGRQPLKNFTWSIFQHLVPFVGMLIFSHVNKTYKLKETMKQNSKQKLRIQIVIKYDKLDIKLV